MGRTVTVQHPLIREPRHLDGASGDRAPGGRRPEPPRRGTGRRVAAYFLGAIIVCGIGMRSWSSSPLWLDEAQTVAIARLPVDQLFAALREDGSPPLYYLLLHAWMLAFGESDVAVRGFSALVSVATIPLIWGLARRVSGSPAVAWAALVLTATSPFAIRYATEARMYSFVMLLTVLGGYALLALRRGGPLPVLAVAGVTAALMLTHYWTFFLLAFVGGAMAYLAWRRRGTGLGRAALRGLFGLAAGVIPFLPWVPSFLHQMAHTGAPWASPAWFTSVGGVVDGWAGAGLPGQLVATLYWAFAVLAVAGRIERGRLVFARPVRRMPVVLAAFAFVPLTVGVGVSHVLGSAYAERYSSIALAPFLVLLGYGMTVVPERFRYQVLGAVALLGLLSSTTAITLDRTQAEEVADAIRANAAPGDVVVVCPDQLGPGLRRQLPGDRYRQVAYPTFEDPVRVDWTDYAERNGVADPAAFAERVHRTAGDHTVWLAYADGYRTMAYQCSQLRSQLQQRHGTSQVVVEEKMSVLESATLVSFAPKRG